MAVPAIKTSFASGEWAPKLRSRVDVQKYHSGAALMRNFFVDYSGGGASTRQGTRFINQAKISGARLIPFQPSTSLSYVLEFGQNYIRFFSNGAPILESALTGGTAASGDVFTINNNLNFGDWVLASGWGGLTNVNGNYFLVGSVSPTLVTVTDVNGAPVTFAGAYTSGGQLQRVYTISSPYAAADLFPNQATGNPGLKFVQNVTSLIITHPNYAAHQLVIVSPTNWSLTSIAFAASILPPGTPTVVTSAAGTTWNYAYVVTSVDVNGQESAPSAPGTVQSANLINSTATTNTVSWTAVTGAVSYNVYKALPSLSAIVSGAEYGFISNVTGVSFQESTPGIAADFSTTPPVTQNPFQGGSVASLQLTANASYTSVPTVTLGAAPAGGQTATAAAALSVASASVNNGGSVSAEGASPVGQSLTFPNNIVCLITAATGSGDNWAVTGISLSSSGSITSGSAPATETATGISGGFVIISKPIINVTWHIGSLILVSGGSGYLTPPSVTFSSGGASANTVLSAISSGNPGVPGFIQQRLALAGQSKAVQSFNFSQPGSFYNFNVSNPIQASDAISGNIISEDLNDIRWFVAVPSGLLAGTGKGAWLINGGGGISTQVPITPADVTAQAQAFNGSNDLRPLKVNFDLLHVTNKGNYVRDLSYNLYAQIFTGSDISVLSNHLFFGHTLVDWCFAEEPFKTAWAVRDDGQMLSLGYVKEQDLIGWAHHDTNGQFLSVCSVIETVPSGTVDAVYVITRRQLVSGPSNGLYVQYIERMADRYFPYGFEDSWSVDCALQTSPAVTSTGILTILSDGSTIGNNVGLVDNTAPFTSTMATNNWIVRANGGIYKIVSFTSSTTVNATVVRVSSALNTYDGVPYPVFGGYTIWQPVSSVSGLTQLPGQSVVGVADGTAIGPLLVSASGSVTLGLTATKVTLGLAFLPQLQTLPLDLGEPTVQGKLKKATALTLRVADTLGLSVGRTFQTLVAMKDFLIGAIPSISSGVAKVTDLYSGDGRTIMDQQWETLGSYCIQQNLPYPATVLGCIPEVTVEGK